MWGYTQVKDEGVYGIFHFDENSTDSYGGTMGKKQNKLVHKLQSAINNNDHKLLEALLTNNTITEKIANKCLKYYVKPPSDYNEKIARALYNETPFCANQFLKRIDQRLRDALRDYCFVYNHLTKNDYYNDQSNVRNWPNPPKQNPLFLVLVNQAGLEAIDDQYHDLLLGSLVYEQPGNHVTNWIEALVKSQTNPHLAPISMLKSHLDETSLSDQEISSYLTTHHI